MKTSLSLSLSFRKVIFTSLSLLSIIGYGTFVFAVGSTPPLGGYNPGTELDPNCLPIDPNCIVKVPMGSGSLSNTYIGYGNNANTITGDSHFTRDADGFTNIGKISGLQSQVTFSGTGDSEITVISLGYSGAYPAHFKAVVNGNTSSFIKLRNITGGSFSVGDVITSSSGGSATIQSIFSKKILNNQSFVTLSGITGNFFHGDSITNGVVTGNQEDSINTSNSLDLYFNGVLVSNNSHVYEYNNIVIGHFDTGATHIVGDQWEWDYTPSEKFSFKLTNDLDGYGIEGIQQSYKNGNTVASIGIIDSFEDGAYPNVYARSTDDLTFSTESNLSKAGISMSFQDMTANIYSSFSIERNGFGLHYNDNSFNGGISFNSSNKILEIGNYNNTSIQIDDQNQKITFNGKYSFPFLDGTAGQVLTTDGAGQLSWTNASSGSSPVALGSSGKTLYTPVMGAGQGNPFFGSNMFFGSYAGSNATSTDNGNFFGSYAGSNATSASNSNFFGYAAGLNATSAANSNFFGSGAGNGATNASSSNFFAYQAGQYATNASQSNFFGLYAGYNATYASNSNFFGIEAGYRGYNASNSIFLGRQSGYMDTVNNTNSSDDFSILIGPNTSTGGNSNSIALGGYATNTLPNQFMIGSTTRPINDMVIIGSGFTTCSVNTITGAGISCSSDERLKTNITDLTSNTLDTISKIKTVNFNWINNNDNQNHIGFLAQDLLQYYPELVSMASNGYYQVNYAGMTPILVEAIREMNLNITQLSDINRSNTWRDGLVAWLGNVTNGITNIFTKNIHVENICVKKSDSSEVCFTGDQINQVLQTTVTQSVVTSQNPIVNNPSVTPPNSDTQEGSGNGENVQSNVENSNNMPENNTEITQ